MDMTFAALADPTRRAILSRLARGEASVGELAEPFEVSLPAVSKHLRVLERAGLLQQQRDGRMRRCRLTAQPLEAAWQWVNRYQRFWESQLDALALYLETPRNPGPPESQPAAPEPSLRSSDKTPGNPCEAAKEIPS